MSIPTSCCYRVPSSPFGRKTIQWESKGACLDRLAGTPLIISSIYGEIGSGQRIALSKLSADHIESTGRPLRIAVDVSIWQFQVKSGKRGRNPALRTLYYRLIRLLSLSIHPLFIFDGTNKPPFKRNAKTNKSVESLPNMMVKTMLKFFGFPFLTAPGEAEAECALLQMEGLVDAVLSEDVDTLMFGCSKSLRNWSSEGSRSSKTPTHVNVYCSKAIEEGKSNIHKEGMILVALMSGGDYIPAGIPGCGIKIACEAARAGFGRDLCKLSRKDTVGIKQWRERLKYELHTNESGFFRVRHKALQVPEDFPDRAVLGYYKHPSVSSSAKVSELRKSIQWGLPIDVAGLRSFVGEAFEWQHLSGAKHFIRGLAPALFIHTLYSRSMDISRDNDHDTKVELEMKLVHAVCGRRTYLVTDSTPELRVTYTPAAIVDLDLTREESESFAGVADVDSDGELLADEGRNSQAENTSTGSANSAYDPTKPDKIWILEVFAKLGVPLMVENWEADMKDPKKFASRKAQGRNETSKKGMKQGNLDEMFSSNRRTKMGMSGRQDGKLSELLFEKPIAALQQGKKLARRVENEESCGTSSIPNSKNLEQTVRPRKNHNSEAIVVSPKRPLAKEKTGLNSSNSDGARGSGTHTTAKILSKHKRGGSEKHSTLLKTPTSSPTGVETPWTLSKRPSDTPNVLQRGIRPSALEIWDITQAIEADDLLPSPKLREFVHPNSVSHIRPSFHHDISYEQIANSNSTKGVIIDLCSSPLSNLVEVSPSPKKRQSRNAEVHKTREQTFDRSVDLEPDSGKEYEVENTAVPILQGKDAPVVEFTTVLRRPPKFSLENLNNIVSDDSIGGGKTSLTKHSKKHYVPRSSLIGAWKEIDSFEADFCPPKCGFSDLEVIDLTQL